MSELAGAIGVHAEEASIIAELKAGSEDAYAWLISQYHQPIYSLIYRILDDPSDAPDTTQEVFLKVFRGMKRFNGESSLKTWIYRIAVHEASNRRRWWFRHKVRETSIEPSPEYDSEGAGSALAVKDTLVDAGSSPFENVMHEEVRAKVELELSQLAEPYRTTVILRDIEELSYEQIAEVMEVSLGTVKSRLVRGRSALKKRLERYVRESGSELGLQARQDTDSDGKNKTRGRVGAETGNRMSGPAIAHGNQEVEVTP
ncbi:MAG TPA: sigma-70 family RNA polymerase sigma factor [Clostridia bacterium]|nr:sigma-70 family RNA polymerase sigma factor [Clostridia bacterium]